MRKKLLRSATFMFALVGGVVLVGCVFDLPAPPPEPPVAVPPVAVAHSSVVMPIQIDVQELKAAFENDLKAQVLFDGHSPELGVKLLAEEKSIFQEPKKIIDVPYKAVSCQIKKVPRTIKRWGKVGVQSYGCWLQPWKWGTCVKDVMGEITETVIDEVKDCTPEQLEVARTVYTTVEKITPRIFDTTAVVNYKGRLDTLSLALNGNVLDTHLSVRVPVSVDVKAGILGESVTAKGLLACESVLDLDAKISVGLVQTGDGVSVKAAVKDFHPDLKQLCVPGAVQLANAWSLTSPEAFALSNLLESVVQKQMQAQAEKALDKAAAGLSFNDALVTAVSNLRGPKRVAEDVWLKVEPGKVLLAQIEGRTTDGVQTLMTTAGLETDLTVLYGAQPVVAPAANKLQVTLGAAGNAFHLVPRGTVSLKKMREVMLTELRKAAGDQLAGAGFEISAVKAYQSGPLVVFGVEMKGTKPWRPSGTVYLSGRPVYDGQEQAIRLEQLDFTLESKNWLVEKAGALAHDKLVARLADIAVFKVDDHLGALLDKFRTFKIDIGTGVISGTVTSAKLGGVWMQGDALNFDLVLDGTSRLDLKL